MRRFFSWNFQLICMVALVMAGCRPAATGQDKLQGAAVEGIDIHYQYSGWGSYEEHFSITPNSKGSGFLMEGRYVDSDGRKRTTQGSLSTDVVGELLQAATEPPWRRDKGIRALAAGISSGDLTKLEPEIRMPSPACTLQERNRRVGQQIKRLGLPALVDKHYGHGLSWTDDYPYVMLTLKLEGQPPLLIHSSSQKAMMLPWRHGEPMEPALQDDENWSLPLSWALRDILPKDSSFHGRLGNESLPVWLMRNMDHQISRECAADQPK